MKREDILLAVLAASNGRPYTPVQIQKTLFLLAVNLPRLFPADSRYNFIPYDYGPFDSAVYTDAGSLARDGLAAISQSPNAGWKCYAATEEGIDKGNVILNKISIERRSYIKEVSEWVRRQGFTQLVKAIYDDYPDMKVNSVFKG